MLFYFKQLFYIELTLIRCAKINRYWLNRWLLNCLIVESLKNRKLITDN